MTCYKQCFFRLCVIDVFTIGRSFVAKIAYLIRMSSRYYFDSKFHSNIYVVQRGIIEN